MKFKVMEEVKGKHSESVPTTINADDYYVDEANCIKITFQAPFLYPLN
jgi:hypothetical protein